MKFGDYVSSGTNPFSSNAQSGPKSFQAAPNYPNGNIFPTNPTTPTNPSNNDPLTDLMRSTGQDPAQVPLWQNWFIHKQSIGSTGTESYAGYPREEYLHELLGKDRAKIFDKMWRSDPQIAMLVGAVVNQIASAIWEVDPDPENPKDSDAQKRADLISHILMNGMSKEGGFPRFIEECLSAVRVGHAVFEKTYKLVVNDPQFGTYHGVQSLDLVNSKTIYRFNLDQDGKLASITQIAIGDLHRYVDIPSNFLMVLSINREGSNYEGVSLLRPCYGAFIRKNLIHKLNIIGIEKYAVPTPIISVPDGKQNTQQFAELIAALEVYTSGQSNYLTIPSMFKIEFPNRAQYDPTTIDEAITNEDKRMAGAFLASFLVMGGTKGSSSSSKSAGMADLADFFLCGLERIANGICQMINEDLIPELCIYNFGDKKNLPRLRHSGITDKAGSDLATALSLLAGNAPLIEPDDNLEANLRKRFQLPEKSVLGASNEPTVPGSLGVPKPVDMDHPPTVDGKHTTDPTKATRKIGAPPPAPGSKEHAVVPPVNTANMPAGLAAHHAANNLAPPAPGHEPPMPPRGAPPPTHPNAVPPPAPDKQPPVPPAHNANPPPEKPKTLSERIRARLRE